MASGAKITWSGDLAINLEKLSGDMRTAIMAAAHSVAPEAEAWMRTNAPWTDQTGNARNGLRARAETAGSGARIVLFHSVPYGIWLEVRWGGRYAIIGPAVEEFAPRFMERAAKPDPERQCVVPGHLVLLSLLGP